MTYMQFALLIMLAVPTAYILGRIWDWAGRVFYNYTLRFQDRSRNDYSNTHNDNL